MPTTSLEVSDSSRDDADDVINRTKNYTPTYQTDQFVLKNNTMYTWGTDLMYRLPAHHSDYITLKKNLW